MILLNVEQVLEGIEGRISSVTDIMDGMSHIDNELLIKTKQHLSSSLSVIHQLEMIRDGINYVQANHPDADVRLSVTEIGLLDSANITPDLAEHGDG